MAENVQETRPPEPPPKPPEVPKPTEQSTRQQANDQGGQNESQESAQEDARNAVQSEYAKATKVGQAEELRPTTEQDWAAHSQDKTDTQNQQGLLAHDLRRTSEQTEPENSEGTTAEADRATETAARLDDLRNEGHGPQRHHDPTDQQLTARMGEPVLDTQTGAPVLKNSGHVVSENHIDPMTGTTVDGVHGNTHRCGNFATRFDSPLDYVAADRFMRENVGEDLQARRPISEVLGPQAHERMTGFYHDPKAPGSLKPVDFTDGTIFALYEQQPNGNLRLRTMYVDPAYFDPSNEDRTDQ